MYTPCRDKAIVKTFKNKRPRLIPNSLALSLVAFTFCSCCYYSGDENWGGVDFEALAPYLMFHQSSSSSKLTHTVRQRQKLWIIFFQICHDSLGIITNTDSLYWRLMAWHGICRRSWRCWWWEWLCDSHQQHHHHFNYHS